MPQKIQKQIKSITVKACGARTAEQFGRELGIILTKPQLRGFLEGVTVPGWDLLRGVLSSPYATPNGRAWARACLKAIEKVIIEPSVEMEVERRL